jgi:lipopolysaccharide assembly outer membrane protein LptD (OstA)
LAVIHSNHQAVSDTATDSLKNKKQDTTHIKQKKKPPLDAKVDYQARDSIRLDAKIRKVYLYGDAIVKYENLELKAAYIDILLDSNIAYAIGVKDSGKTIGRPEFHQGSDVFYADEIRYNFKTKKGRINGINTKEGEGYIHGKVVKKDSTNVYYIKNGRYTTCDKEQDPHFFIAAYKLKVIPNNQVVTGPAMMYIEGVPTPLVIPFGFFPLTNGRHSGIVIPTYGESASQGFFLTKGGYYLGLNDNFGTEVTGDIYTNGSWALRDEVDYSNRYHYQGTLNVAMSETILPVAESAQNLTSHDYLINWQHAQDVKARPNSTFSASVNLASTTYYSNNSYDPANILNNTLASSVRFSQDFPRAFTPMHLTLSADNSENTINNTVTTNLPQLTFTADRIYPFKMITGNPSSKIWYNNISMGLSTTADNQINTLQSELFTNSTLKKMQNGISSTIPIAGNFQVFRYFTLTPSVNINSVDFFQSIREKWNSKIDSVRIDTVQGFQSATTINSSVALTTSVYGMYSLGLKRAIIIREVFYPALSFSYRPDYSEAMYGYYRSVQTNATGITQKYSIFQNEAIASGPGQGKYGVLGFSLATNLEMKVRVNTDSGVTYKKIKLLERFGITTGYNAFADSMHWQTINIAGNTTLFKKLALNFNGNIDPYYEGNSGVDVNRSIWNPDNHNGIGRLTSAEFSLSTTITSSKPNSQNKSQQGGVLGTGTKPNSNETPGGNTGLQLNSPSDYFYYEQMHPLYWAPMEIAPWSLTINYTFNYTAINLVPSTGQSVLFNGSMQLSKYWYASVSSGYDLKANQFTQTLLSATRDMHCWTLMFTSVPFGYRQSFMLNVHVKASVLTDLKLQRTRSWEDTQQFN